MSKQEKTTNLEEGAETSTDNQFCVHSVKHLTNSSYILRFDRNSMEFAPGQHLTLGMLEDKQLREYSIYSPNNVNYLEVLIKEVEEGHVSKRLKKLQAGQAVNVEGPFGFFTIDAKKKDTHKFLFIASGTGIAPFHSIVNSVDKLDYKILHGVRYGEEQYASNEYPNNRYIGCTSRDKEGGFHGRVTDYLKQNKVDSNTLVYLCGNYEMIHEVYDILTTKGLSPDNIRTEVYF
jgi:ferredoxin/flavodoxin---NADP+ reductase